MAQKRDERGDKILSRSKRTVIRNMRPIKDRHRGRIPIRRDKRREVIVEQIKPRRYFCPGLKSYVIVTQEDIRHFKNQSSQSYESMKALLNIRSVIKKGTLLDVDDPKANQSQKRFVKMYLLFCKITGVGVVKLVVGKHKQIPGRKEVYSITAVRIKK